MSDDNVIDAEVVDIEDSDRLPAVIEDAHTHEPAPPIEGRDWSTYSRPERRCVAHSSRTGEQCKNVAIKGGKVCRYHGGNAPHVIANARARLQNAADLMARQLLGIALTADTESVKLAAIKDALDRAGLKPPAEVVVSPGQAKPAFEAVFDSIGGDPAAAGFDSGSTEDDGPHTSPAPAYDTGGCGGQAEAGRDGTGSGDTGEHGGYRPADEHGEASDDAAPPPPSRPRPRAREAQLQPPSRHVTGEAAMQAANWANQAMAESHGLPWGESDCRRRR